MDWAHEFILSKTLHVFLEDFSLAFTTCFKVTNMGENKGLLWAPPQKLDDGMEGSVNTGRMWMFSGSFQHCYFHFIFILLLHMHTYLQLERGKECRLRREKSLWRIVYQAAEMNCGPLKPSVWWNPLPLCCHSLSQGITSALPSSALPAAHSELQLLLLTCDNALQCQRKMQLLSPVQPADPREHWDGDLPAQHMAQVKGKSIEEHQNAGNYFFDLLCYYLHTLGSAHMYARISRIPSMTVIITQPIWDQIKQSPVIHSLLHDFF